MAAELPCGDSADARYCPKFWELTDEIKRLQDVVRELLENTGLDDDEQAAYLERAGIHDDDEDDDIATTPLGAAEDIADGLVTLSAEELRDVLLLVGEDVTPEAIASWSDQDRYAVARWAATEHLHASDNPVNRLPRPAVLVQLDEDAQAEADRAYREPGQ